MTSTAVSVTTASRARLARWAIPALVAWTLLVWVGRIRNVLADDALSATGTAWRLGLAGSLVTGAVIVGATMVAAPRRTRTAARILAAVGIVVWTVRGTQIALADHPAGFIAVHSALAVATIALSAFVLATTAGPTRSPSTSRYPPLDG